MELSLCQYMHDMKLMPLIYDRTFQMRANDDWLVRLDDWRRQQAEIPSRAEAIRILVALGIEACDGSREQSRGT